MTARRSWGRGLLRRGGCHVLFDSAQIGAQALEITVDGQTTPIGSAYLAGPVTTAPLLDGGGTDFIEPGAFLHPLTPGTHTVFISGGLFGDLVTAALGVPSRRRSPTPSPSALDFAG